MLNNFEKYSASACGFECACANVLASMCVTHGWRPAGWRAAGHMPLYTQVHMYCACGCRSTCVCVCVVCVCMQTGA